MPSICSKAAANMSLASAIIFTHRGTWKSNDHHQCIMISFVKKPLRNLHTRMVYQAVTQNKKSHNKLKRT